MTEKLFYLLAILAVALAIGVGIGSVAFAQPAEPTPTWVTIDAGAELDAGAAAMAEPTKAIPDPVDDPTSFAGEFRDAYKQGLWSYLVVLVLFGLARLGVWAGRKWPRRLSWMQGKPLAALVAACSVLSATAVEAAVGGGWKVIAGALMAAVVLYLRPEPKGS